MELYILLLMELFNGTIFLYLWNVFVELYSLTYGTFLWNYIDLLMEMFVELYSFTYGTFLWTYIYSLNGNNIRVEFLPSRSLFADSPDQTVD